MKTKCVASRVKVRNSAYNLYETILLVYWNVTKQFFGCFNIDIYAIKLTGQL